MADTESVTNDGEPRRRRSGLAAVMVRTQRLLHRRIARAEARRAADRAQVMGLDSFPARRGAREAGTSEETGGQTAPVGVLSSLPGWLVRGGIGSWLGLGIFLVVALVFLGINRIVPVFVGVFIALVVTAILHPLVTFFARVMPRYPATFLALATTAAFLAALVYYVVSSVTDQWSSLAAQFSTGVNTILDFVEHGPLPIHFSQQEVVQTMQGLVNQGQRYVESNATSLAGEVLSNAGTVVNVFVVLALAVFTSIFLLASGGRMWRWFLNELPAHLRSRVHRAAGAGWYTFAGYARGTVILALTDAVMAGVFLQVVGVPLAARWRCSCSLAPSSP